MSSRTQDSAITARHNFVYGSSAVVPAKLPSLRKQRRMVGQLAKIIAQATQEPNFRFLCFDESYPTAGTRPGRCWYRAGEKPTLVDFGHPQRVHVLASADPVSGETVVSCPQGNITQDSVIAHLHQVRSRFPSERLVIFLDNACIHKTRKVLAAAESLNMELMFNLPYCPHLNLVERLWRVMNHHVRDGCCLPSSKVLRSRIRTLFRTGKESLRAEVRSALRPNFQTLAPVHAAF